MNYKGYLLRKVDKINGGYFIEIYKDDKLLISALDFTTAKTIIDMKEDTLC